MNFEKLLKYLNEKLYFLGCNESDSCIYIECTMPIEEHKCIYCGEESHSVHSTYVRTINDLPIQGFKVKLLLKTHKYFCNNPNCSHKTFCETFDFVNSKAVRTKRLDEYINNIGLRNNSMDAVRNLNEIGIEVSSNTVLRIIKKNHQLI